MMIEDFIYFGNDNPSVPFGKHGVIQGGNLRDVRLRKLIESGKYIVTSIEADDFGGFELIFSNDIRLTIFPTISSKSIYSEYWRLLDNRSNESKHVVVGPLGFEIIKIGSG
jgi:hypothetical protein